MLRKSKNPVEMKFSRGGGSIIVARVDVWKATPGGWEAIAIYDFKNALSRSETLRNPLPPDSYVCVFQCFVEESLNGKYEFLLDVAGEGTYTDSGDVNVSAASNDSKVFKDQFVLEVREV